MIYISHRGNLYGPNPELENKPDQINKVLSMGYDVEVDVWKKNNLWYLGHDEPVYKIEEGFLLRRGVWCHAKTITTFESLIKIDAVSFWHQEDDCTFTTNKYIWTYPGKELTPSSICVMPENTEQEIKNCAGVCTDYPIFYKEKTNEIK